MSGLSGPSGALQDRLHPVFDGQVLNYGAYNLIYATGTAEHRDPSIHEVQGSDQRHFLLGYRRAPTEMVIAPFDPKTLGALGLPFSVDNTNLVRAESLGESSILLETSSGSVLRLDISPLIEVPTADGPEVLEQEADVEDFRAFLGE